MHDLFKIFISLRVGARLALIFGIIFLVWLILAKPLLKIFSILPWIIKKIFYCLYMLFEIPISILHSKFGGMFGTVDQGLTLISDKFCTFIDNLYKKMRRPNTIFSKRLLVVYLVLCAYLLVPVFANLTEKPFTFWQNYYVEKETGVIHWMENKGWIEK